MNFTDVAPAGFGTERFETRSLKAKCNHTFIQLTRQSPCAMLPFCDCRVTVACKDNRENAGRIHMGRGVFTPYSIVLGSDTVFSCKWKFKNAT
jgi:hypothetical protein